MGLTSDNREYFIAWFSGRWPKYADLAIKKNQFRHRNLKERLEFDNLWAGKLLELGLVEYSRDTKDLSALTPTKKAKRVVKEFDEFLAWATSQPKENKSIMVGDIEITKEQLDALDNLIRYRSRDELILENAALIEKVERLKNCVNCKYGSQRRDSYAVPGCWHGANSCVRWNYTDNTPDLWEEYVEELE